MSCLSSCTLPQPAPGHSALPTGNVNNARTEREAAVGLLEKVSLPFRREPVTRQPPLWLWRLPCLGVVSEAANIFLEGGGERVSAAAVAGNGRVGRWKKTVSCVVTLSRFSYCARGSTCVCV